MIYFCGTENRRNLVRNQKVFNGIDYLEVISDDLDTSECQRTLHVFFVNTPEDIAPYNLRTALKNKKFTVSISGGERITGITVDKAEFDTVNNRLFVHLKQRGDFSVYTLSIHEFAGTGSLSGLDSQLASIDFNFKIKCASNFDYRAEQHAIPSVRPVPEIDYLTRDYTGFRRLVLDRMSSLMPGWQERTPADMGIALVDLISYVGDHLSYRQDAIGTEAYLGTARQRVSVRRHARLLDYPMHDGCNARVWVQVRLKNSAPPGGVTLPRLAFADSRNDNGIVCDPLPGMDSEKKVIRTRFFTNVNQQTVMSIDNFEKVAAADYPEIFEPVMDAKLFVEHNEMTFYTWGETECCLPKGAIKAALKGCFSNLKPGDVLIFAEMLSPTKLNRYDADPEHRWAVRLTKVRTAEDPLFINQGNAQMVTEIEWGAGDALPFSFCISTSGRDDITAALGNIILADHGMTILQPEWLGTMPKANPVLTPVAAQSGCHSDKTQHQVPPRFNPQLKQGPLTHAAYLTGMKLTNNNIVTPASSFFSWDMKQVVPACSLGDNAGKYWLPQSDLLVSAACAREFVVEMGNDGKAAIRFGDDECGMRPAEGSQFWARYRVGNGTRGNVGAESVTHIVCKEDAAQWIESISNPLPATGGQEPETIDDVRDNAPAALSINSRAVTAEDYAQFAAQHPEVQRAAAITRWTGSWYTIFLSIDRIGGNAVDAEFEERLRDYLEPYRMAGHDLEINGPRLISLQLSMTVYVKPFFYRNDVHTALLEVFSSRIRPDGTPGFFHPDNFSFGDTLHCSRIYAAAQSVTGVDHVEITILKRLGDSGDNVPKNSKLEFDRMEIPGLDNNRNFPDRGILNFSFKGGL
jgi:hypothetical protein